LQYEVLFCLLIERRRRRRRRRRRHRHHHHHHHHLQGLSFLTLSALKHETSLRIMSISFLLEQVVSRLSTSWRLSLRVSFPYVAQPWLTSPVYPPWDLQLVKDRVATPCTSTLSYGSYLLN
jgi:hypothetical protein